MLLEEIVAYDNKQRFAFNADKTKIRANQGHSIMVDVELVKTRPWDILWHGTAEKYAKAIDKLKNIICYLLAKYHSVTIKNVDSSYPEIIKMLQDLGFETIVKQYEMVRKF